MILYSSVIRESVVALLKRRTQSQVADVQLLGPALAAHSNSLRMRSTSAFSFARRPAGQGSAFLRACRGRAGTRGTPPRRRPRPLPHSARFAQSRIRLSAVVEDRRGRRRTIDTSAMLAPERQRTVHARPDRRRQPLGDPHCTITIISVTPSPAISVLQITGVATT